MKKPSERIKEIADRMIERDQVLPDLARTWAVIKYLDEQAEKQEEKEKWIYGTLRLLVGKDNHKSNQ